MLGLTLSQELVISYDQKFEVYGWDAENHQYRDELRAVKLDGAPQGVLTGKRRLKEGVWWILEKDQSGDWESGWNWPKK